MNISMEQIDEMRKRTNCSYQEAKELLEKHNGELVEAIIEFENKHGYKSRHEHRHDHFERKQKAGKKIKEHVHKGFVTRFIIEKEGNTILNVPVIILLIAVLITMPIFWIYPIAFIVIYLMGYKIRIRKEEGQEVDINEIVDGIGDKVRTATDKMCDKTAEKDQNSNSSGESSKSGAKKEDDVNEITIE